MAAEYSKPVIVSLGGVHVLEASEADFEVVGNDSSVFTLALGLAGHSDGASEATINTTSAIPSTGVEVDWAGIILDKTTVDMGYNIAGQEFVLRGRVLRCQQTSAVNQPNRYTMSFHGRVIRRPTAGG